MRQPPLIDPPRLIDRPRLIDPSAGSSRRTSARPLPSPLSTQTFAPVVEFSLLFLFCSRHECKANPSRLQAGPTRRSRPILPGAVAKESDRDFFATPF